MAFLWCLNALTRSSLGVRLAVVVKHLCMHPHSYCSVHRVVYLRAVLVLAVAVHSVPTYLINLIHTLRHIRPSIPRQHLNLSELG